MATCWLSVALSTTSSSACMSRPRHQVCIQVANSQSGRNGSGRLCRIATEWPRAIHRWTSVRHMSMAHGRPSGVGDQCHSCANSTVPSCRWNIIIIIIIRWQPALVLWWRSDVAIVGLWVSTHQAKSTTSNSNTSSHRCWSSSKSPHSKQRQWQRHWTPHLSRWAEHRV